MAAEMVVRVAHPDDIVAARQAGRELASQLGFSLTDVTMIATAISEVARNITSYADHGEIRLSIVQRAGRSMLEVKAVDSGPGIANTDQALQDGYSSGGGLGLGLPGARRVMDEFIIDSIVGQGTTVTMRMWAPRHA
ncbi:anti-sigma regulatory factor [Tenggerimyces flavus]|uniref:Anti-sigma regulatory factor n=1 Tax=Tenggerimyces flavus TaxID=1708749 RepID=A0ABV7YFL5_9ACTN|nr:anti-sigma regulatory factor [Tenggerimyces flavus]MBM7783389.1 serine/threonine-protein kinase RsbT [Tenggerimyces flavus]